MHAWQSIQNVLEYIEQDVARPHSTEELAQIAALSPFYFQRLFTRLVKRPVNEYIKMRRLAKASEKLGDKSRRILDIALEYGFNSHEHFTKTFKNAFGITPEEYRANPVHLSQIIKPELLLKYTMVDEGVPLIAGDIVLEITRREIATPETYMGLAGAMAMNQASLGEATSISGPGQLWDTFHQMKKPATCFVAGGIELGASMLGESEDAFTYFAGALARPEAAVPRGFTAWVLPAGKYVVCTFEAESEFALTTSALNQALAFLLETWLPQKKLAIQPFSAEKYTGRADGVASMELWVALL